MEPMTRRMRSVAATLAMVALLGVLAGCSSSSTPDQTSSPTSTASSAAGCADITALKASLDALTQVRPLQDGVDSLTTAIANVKSSLDAAVASASATLQPEVTQVKEAFTRQLLGSVHGLTTDNLTQKAPGITTSLAQLATATQALGTSVTQNCAGS